MRIRSKTKATYDHPRKAALVARLAAIPAGEAVSADDLRAAIGVTADQLPDAAIYQLALDAGHEVES